MSETQLERSVLEAKERDELFAIADALGAKPGTRAKKADLVTQILRATGIEPQDAGDVREKPRRTRARRSTAADSAEPTRPDRWTGATAAGAALARHPAAPPAGAASTALPHGAGRDRSAAHRGRTPAARLRAGHRRRPRPGRPAAPANGRPDCGPGPTSRAGPGPARRVTTRC